MVGEQKATQIGLCFQEFLRQHCQQYRANPSFWKSASAIFSTIVSYQSIEDKRSTNLIYALMTGLLDIEQDERILEISAGSGYRRAVLVTLASKVSSVEYSRGSTNLPKNICQALGTKKFDPSAKRFGLKIRLTTRLSPPQLPSSCKIASKNSLRRADGLLAPIGRQREL